jgi:hypothetical protein
LLPGLGTGLVLVLVVGAGLPVAVAWPQLAQAHGQVQALGFVLLFIVAVGLQLFPRFLGTPLRHANRATWGGGLVALALLARWLGQPLPPGPTRLGLLLLAAIAVPIGALVAGSAFHGLRPRHAATAQADTPGGWRRFIAAGGLCLGLALVLYLWAGLDLALGDVVVPAGLDEALVQLELTGFATSFVFAVASRVFGRFLLLRTRPSLDRRVPLLAGLWGAGVLLVVLGWLFDVPWSAWLRWLGSLVELGVVVGWVLLVGLYDPASRESGTPHVTNPTRRWVRLAVAFLLLGLALHVGWFGREALRGAAPSSTELSAARHALAQGFLMPLMVAMAVRVLPVISGDALRHRLRVELILDLLFLGALLRVGAEAVGGYSAVSGPLIAFGGTLTVAGFSWFALGMWSSLRRMPRSYPSG